MYIRKLYDEIAFIIILLKLYIYVTITSPQEWPELNLNPKLQGLGGL